MVGVALARTAAGMRFNLSRNEIPYRPLPGVRAAVEAQIDHLACYPDPLARELGAAIAADLGVAETCVLPGHGSTGALITVLRAVRRPEATVAFATPGFTGYGAIVRAAGADPRPVAGRRGGWQPLDAMAAAVRADRNTVAVILTSPHNPSGEVVRAAELEAFVRMVPPTVLVILDEAYLDFDEGYEPAAILAATSRHPNLVLTRSFSKAHGLAALRVGYAVGQPDFLRTARAEMVAYDIGSSASLAAIASLRHPRELAERVAEVRAVRDTLLTVVRRSGYPAPASFGNFVWLPTVGTAPLSAAFAARGVSVCEYPALGIRITAATAQSVAAVSGVLEAFAAEQGATG
ncbi:pyridoxal phosphate-dependent aminotransferase [Nocardia higoensis]|uniref:pyridoxal phosphate-dependent aminotransferase n=1 Tax=Nocardia higoensis TaxID=228599 RepID=UPI000310D3AD|nr:aminotransferase class I/II-fold pyridoxal phosphate-dependent enzyme [Nocardia higoensis]